MDEIAFRQRGERFDDEDVARCYAFRPPYAPSLFNAVLARAPGRRKLLDLGTGNGKIAGSLSPHFDHVTAIDPSRPMLDSANSLWRNSRNIDWVCGTGEEMVLEGAYDLVTAGASVHWMRPDIVFPKLASHLAERGKIAIIVGDFAHDPPWHEAWNNFVEQWTVRLGDVYQPEKWHSNYAAHEAWMSIEHRETFIHRVEQSIAHFIECQHSRASWARHKIGPVNAAAFDAELRAMLEPFARDGVLAFNVMTNLTLGEPIKI